MFLHQTQEHSTEVLAHELSHEGWAGVFWDGVDVVFAEHGVGQCGAGFEGNGFGEDERVVAVEEEGCYLRRLVKCLREMLDRMVETLPLPLSLPL